MNRTVYGPAHFMEMWAYEEWLEQQQQFAEDEADHYFEAKP
jgi:hypothetical protein